MRRGTDGQAIEIFAAAAKKEIVNLELIFAIRRYREIEQAAAAVALQFLSGGIIQNQSSVHSRVNFAGFTVDQNSLAFPGGELVERKCVRFGMAVDDCAQRNSRGVSR